jgi:hypothetical protein
VQVLLQLLLIGDVLELTLTCLCYDYIGTMTDDGNDETQSVQVPTQWRAAIIGTDIVSMLFDLYIPLPDDTAAKVVPYVRSRMSISLNSHSRVLCKSPVYAEQYSTTTNDRHSYNNSCPA